MNPIALTVLDGLGYFTVVFFLFFPLFLFVLYFGKNVLRFAFTGRLK